jgi:Uri superfamily endonuclease
VTGRRAGEVSPVTFDLPPDPGSYILVLRLHWEAVIDVGALGEQTFPPGNWLYCGSARGPGGMGARIGHHSRFTERPRWHIDYLRLAGTPVEVWYAPSGESLECAWAGLLSGIDGVAEGPRGFGASDCGCRTHLFRADGHDKFNEFSRLAAGCPPGGIRRKAAVRGSAGAPRKGPGGGV